MKTKAKNLTQSFLALVSIGILVVTLVASVLPSHAASAFTMTTQYPGRTVQAGNTVSFDLDMYSASEDPVDVELAAKSLPDGWTGYFDGDGNSITDVYVKNGENDAAASFYLTVPDDAKNGTYQVVLTGTANGTTSTLTLNLTVSEQETGASTLSADYSEQEGASGTAFTFNTTIQNNSAESQSYSLNASAPDGWQVKIVPSGESTQVASIDVDARASKTMTVTITPPDDVQAGDYTIPFTAVSASENLSQDLKVTITGTYGLTITTSSQSLSFDAAINKPTEVTLTVTNSGNIDLTNINLSTSTTPTDWTVEFSDSTIDSLAAGATKNVTMTVTPADSTLAGDYELDVAASTDDNAASTTAAFRVTCTSSTAWGIVGVVIIAAIVAALLWVIRKFGRH